MCSDPEGVEESAFEFDPFRVACDVDSDPVALPPATKFVRYANVKGLCGQSPNPTTPAALYGDANEYMRIYYANRDKLSDPDKIQIGQQLSIPTK